jgi:hypothetical protein
MRLLGRGSSGAVCLLLLQRKAPAAAASFFSTFSSVPTYSSLSGVSSLERASSASVAVLVADSSPQQRARSSNRAAAGVRDGGSSRLLASWSVSNLPSRRQAIVCSKCNTLLYYYAKGGKGALVKCFEKRILVDHTEVECTCPKCETKFARRQVMRGEQCFKIIGGKARMK